MNGIDGKIWHYHFMPSFPSCSRSFFPSRDWLQNPNIYPLGKEKSQKLAHVQSQGVNFSFGADAAPDCVPAGSVMTTE